MKGKHNQQPQLRSMEPPGRRRLLARAWFGIKGLLRAFLTVLATLSGRSQPLSEREGREYLAPSRRGIERRLDGSTLGVRGESLERDVVGESVATSKGMVAVIRIFRAFAPGRAESAEREIDVAFADRTAAEDERRDALATRTKILAANDAHAIAASEADAPRRLPGWRPTPEKWIGFCTWTAGIAEALNGALLVLSWLGVDPVWPSIRVNGIKAFSAVLLGLVLAAGIFAISRIAVSLIDSPKRAARGLGWFLAAVVVTVAVSIGVVRELLFAVGDGHAAIVGSIAFGLVFGLMAVAAEWARDKHLGELDAAVLIAAPLEYANARVAAAQATIARCEARLASLAAEADALLEESFTDRDRVAAERQLSRQYEANAMAIAIARFAPQAFEAMADDETKVDVAPWTHGVTLGPVDESDSEPPLEGTSANEPSTEQRSTPDDPAVPWE